MASNDKFIIHYSEGRGRNLGKAINKTIGWGRFAELFAKPTRTAERFSAYLKMDHEEQVRLKSIDGWIYRTHIAGKQRNAHSGMPSDLATFDLDYATADFMDRVELGLVCSGWEYFAHSTRRHTDEKPRIRLYVLFSRPVSNDEYGALSRIMAQYLDPELTMTDKVSFRPAQMMFKPTVSKDGDWFYHRNTGEPVDPDAIFEHFNATVGDWHNIENLPRVEGEKLREHAEKAENPTEKKGPVGDFCRAYDVIEAIDKFELPYEPVGDHSAKPRYTFVGGTTANGAVIEDGGLFLYSHHGSDPCADMLVNAFDLVRIHKFGKLDEKTDPDAKVTDLPSWKAMLEFLQDDPGYKRQQASSKYDQTAMFDDVMDEYFDDAEEPEVEEEPAAEQPDEDFQADIDELVGKSKPKTGSGAASAADRPRGHGKKKRPPEGWFPDELELDKQGNIVQNLPNAQVIINNDARLFGAIAYDDFMRRIVLRRDIRSRLDTIPACACRDKVRGDIWQDINDQTVRAILAAPNGPGKLGYGIDKLAERDLAAAIQLTALRNKFHPIKDYLWSCEAKGWDGEKRMERLFIDYLGCPDTAYHRQAARMVLIASVTRVFEPGHKFDFSPVLEGEGGIRKSSFIKALYGRENFGELSCDLKDTQKIAETIGGIWALEFPEMTSFHKSDYNDAKQFLSAETDTVRMAYDRRVSVFPRQATFWGTTNNTKYLKDPTGNRRWWPIKVLIALIDTVRLISERDQIWAEALDAYKTLRAVTPAGDDLPLFLSDLTAEAEAVVLQTEARQRQAYEQWVELIRDWLDAPVSLYKLRNEFDHGERMPDPGEEDPEKIMVLRTMVRDSDILKHVLNEEGAVKNQQTIQNFDAAMGSIREWTTLKALTGKDRASCFGIQARWKVRADATPDDIRRGYRVVDEFDGLV